MLITCLFQSYATQYTVALLCLTLSPLVPGSPVGPVSPLTPWSPGRPRGPGTPLAAARLSPCERMCY